eukprot:jgi/Orpsp1_1/1189112/evm.model.d7180000069579.1
MLKTEHKHLSKLNNFSNNDNSLYDDDNTSDDSLIYYRDNKEIKSIANEFLQIAKENSNDFNNQYTNSKQNTTDIESHEHSIKNSNSKKFNNNNNNNNDDDDDDDDNENENEILDDDTNISFLTESSNTTSFNNHNLIKLNNKYYSAEDFLKESNKVNINKNNLNSRLLNEYTELKDHNNKYEQFINDIKQLMNINNLIDIPTLIEIFKKNLYNI